MKKIFTLLLLIPFFTNAQIITTVAGNGWSGFSGDGGWATSAMLNTPNGIVVDRLGNLYIADQQNSRIRKVNTFGIISTFAGNGLIDYLGDGGLATNAEMRQPFSVAVDTSLNVFIGDDNDVIRKVNASGIISTYAGIANTYADAAFNDEGGAASALELIYPLSLVADTLGNVYFIAGSDMQVRKINSAGIVTTVAGNGSYAFSGDGGPATAAGIGPDPLQIAVDRIGNVYIVDADLEIVRKVDTAGIITTFAGGTITGYAGMGDGGPATAAFLWGADGVAVDAAGNVYIAETGSSSIRKVDTAGIITTFAGGNHTYGYSGDHGAAIAAAFNFPGRLAIDYQDNLYIVDNGNNVVRKINIHQWPVAGNTNLCIGDTSALTDTTAPGGTWSSSATSVATVIAATGVVTAIAAGTAVITHTTSSGYKIATINVNPAPQLASPLTTTVCDSNEFAYYPASDISGTTFAWTRAVVAGISNPADTASGNIVEYLNNTTPLPIAVPYVYTLTAAGCSDTQSIWVTVNARPTLSSPLTDTVCDSSYFIYAPASATPGTNFYWFEDYDPGIISTTGGSGAAIIGGTLINTTTAPISVYFQINLTAAPGCGLNVEDILVTVNPYPCSPSLTVNSLNAMEHEINLYPDPVTTSLTVSATGTIYAVAITNMVGQTVFSGKFTTDKVSVNVSELPTGIYFIKINNTEVRKFVKE